MLVLVLLFAYLSSAVNYSVIYSYDSADSTCSNGYVGFYADAGQFQSCGSVNYSCQCIGSACSKAGCEPALPADPPGAIVFATYAADDCSGDALTYAAATSGLCVLNAGGGSIKTECAGSFVQTTYTTSDCTGSGSEVSAAFSGSRCESGFYISCALKCFHKESTITIGEKDYSFDDLKKEDSPCAIPHVFKANGLKIATTCPGVLRVTSEHLVMTPFGFKMAGHLRTGDKLFSKTHAKEADCTITDIQSDVNGQYFGLNCESNHVVSDGYWVSTFGYNHNIPDAWMHYGSKIFGVKTASRIGDSVANLLQRFGLL
jgi:hypothetical protein